MMELFKEGSILFVMKGMVFLCVSFRFRYLKME